MAVQTLERGGETFSQDVPPLMAGDRLSRAEFERRYRCQPHIKKAELIEGVVYTPSPVTFAGHADPHHRLVTWTGVYLAATPGVQGGDNATVRLDNLNEVQPDILLRLEPALGGRSRIDEDDFIAGAPELIIEVAATSANYDMHDKKRAYARSGVAEYLVVLTWEKAVHWFVLRAGEYVELTPGEDGVLRSEIFPGLWLDVAALWRQDLPGLLAMLQQGLQSEAHAAFVERLRTTA
ncbi:MAG: Uma2 family endonuclease [Caldilinea sp.]|uniref:Uma2 family endonuclease n=1 Tax=Caldilinea sp. TaxID=2293560 RepID=UPI0030B721EC